VNQDRRGVAADATNAPTSSDYGAIRILHDGTFIFCFKVSSPPGKIQCQIYNSDGSTKGSNFDVTDKSTDHDHPQITELNDYTMIVTYEYGGPYIGFH
jgi:hypothetical protein